MWSTIMPLGPSYESLGSCLVGTTAAPYKAVSSPNVFVTCNQVRNHQHLHFRFIVVIFFAVVVITIVFVGRLAMISIMVTVLAHVESSRKNGVLVVAGCRVRHLQ